MAAVARAAGVKYPRQLFNLGETGNDNELRIATASPGVVFWRPIDAKDETYKANAQYDPREDT
jgi:hypothetical protein